MKANQLIFLLTFLSVTQLYAQENVIPCASLNSFLIDNQKLTYLDSVYGGHTTKTGLIEFDIEKSVGFGFPEDHTGLFNISNDMTFVWTDVRQSSFSNARFDRYQQYYKGIKVVDGGYTRVAPVDPGSNPCTPVLLLRMSVFDIVNVNTTPNLQKGNIENILKSTFGMYNSDVIQNDPNLEILCDESTSCQPILTWKVYFRDNGDAKLGWLNAMDGAIIKIIENHNHIEINAPTQNYGIQVLNNLSTTANGITSTRLISPDEKIKVYDFSTLDPKTITGTNAFKNNLIPTTTASEWSTATASDGVYQAFYVLQGLAPILSDLDIDFSTIHCGADVDDANATQLTPSNGDFTNFYITVGSYEGIDLGFYDILGHELAHCYMAPYSNIPTAGTIHEGVSDMIGTYLESVIQGGNVDWVIGDTDNKVVEDFFKNKRDLANPEYDCFEDIRSNTNLNSYERSQPMKYWFYLISQGDEASDIPSIGIEKAARIVLDAIPLLGSDAFYDEMVESTLSVAKLKFGACSKEYKAIRTAWQKVCVEVPPNECFSLVGDNIACEESNGLQITAQGEVPQNGYRWYFPIGWEVVGDPVGNVLQGGSQLIVTNIPQYSYYPRYFKITCLNMNTHQTSVMFVKLEDCGHDDLTCAEYFGLAKPSSIVQITNPENLHNNNLSVIAVDLLGRIVYRGSSDEFSQNRFSFFSSPLILVYLDEHGKLVKKEMINFKND